MRIWPFLAKINPWVSGGQQVKAMGDADVGLENRNIWPVGGEQCIYDRIFYMGTQSSPNLSQRLSFRFRCRCRQLIAGGRGFRAFFFPAKYRPIQRYFPKMVSNRPFLDPQPSTKHRIEPRKMGSKKNRKAKFLHSSIQESRLASMERSRFCGSKLYPVWIANRILQRAVVREKPFLGGVRELNWVQGPAGPETSFWWSRFEKSPAKCAERAQNSSASRREHSTDSYLDSPQKESFPASNSKNGPKIGKKCSVPCSTVICRAPDIYTVVYIRIYFWPRRRVYIGIYLGFRRF